MVRRRNVMAGLATLPLAGTLSFTPGWAQEAMALDGDAIATSEGDIIVHPVEHASLVLGFADAVIYVDPVGGAALYEGLPAPTAILVTHEHGDHYDAPTLEAIAGGAPLIVNPAVYDMLPEALKANATAMANGDTGEVTGLPIEAVPAHNTTADRMQYHPEGRDNGYVLTLGDKRVYIAGDTEPTEAMLGLADIEVAFLPMNLPYTMTPEQAVAAINTFKPRIAYPYHYGDSDLSPLETVGDHTEVRLRDWYANNA